MKNREIYAKDPGQQELLNNGVAEVKDTGTIEERRTLRYELETFVCDGQYSKGLRRILETYLSNLKKPEQPAVWVSGFFGCGKSHLVKMLRSLWVDYQFPEDQATARGITQLQKEVSDLLSELSTYGKRRGGLHAAAGTLGAGAGDSVRLALLGIVFKSAELPEQYPLARFAIWLRNNNCLQQVKKSVQQAGKTWEKELPNLYVSPVIANALVSCFPNFTAKASEVGQLLKTQFPHVTDITNDQMVDAIEEALTNNGSFPYTLIALDEVQQYIGDNSDRTYRVQEVTEACSKKFGGALLFVATGQTALSGTPQLLKLKARFRIEVELSDQDVDTVIRQIILAKKPEHLAQLKAVLTQHSGEISRHLVGTRIEAIVEDQSWLVADYPLLPVRRRFWEKVLRAVDQAGTSGQLRNQLKVVYEATKVTADAPLGTVVGADFIFNQLATAFLQTGVLPREIYDNINNLRDGTDDGNLKARLCALVFLIGKLPREAGVDLGVRATPDVLADLLIEDLTTGSAQLRQRIPALLQNLVDRVQLMQVGTEFRLQTRESSAWDGEYRKRLAAIVNDPQRIADQRAELIQSECKKQLNAVKLIQQGQSKEPRKVGLHFSATPPPGDGETVYIWIRDGWNESDKSFETDAQAANTDTPTVFMFIPRQSADELQKNLSAFKAAEETLDARGVPNTPEGHEARTAIETRRIDTAQQLQILIRDDIFPGARVLQGGGQEVQGLTMVDMVKQAANTSLIRLFPKFDEADDPNWSQVVKRAKSGDGAALTVVNYQGDNDKHPVCKSLLQFVAGGKKGAEIRKHFGASPYGWAQDAIDGSLYILLVSGHFKASNNGQPVTSPQLDRSKIGQTDFRVESVTVTATQKIAVRKLVQEVGIPYNSSEEAAKIPAYLQQLKQLAYQAGGDAPLPDLPDTSHITALMQLSGNDQMVAVYNQKDSLSGQSKEWQTAAQEIKQRSPQWQTLQQLLKHSKGLPITAEIQNQSQAISEQRLLLQNPNPVLPLCNQLSQALRDALVKAQEEYQQVYDAQLTNLQATESWQKLDSAQWDQMLGKEGLNTIPQIAVGTEAEVLKSLESLSLIEWRNHCDALPQRFTQARLAAENLLEPQAVYLQLPNATLRNQDDVDKWLDKVSQSILQRLKDGPVII